MDNLSNFHDSLRAKAKTDAALTEKANQAGTVQTAMQDFIVLTAKNLEVWSEVSKDDAVSDSLLQDIDRTIAELIKLHEQGKAHPASATLIFVNAHVYLMPS